MCFLVESNKEICTKPNTRTGGTFSAHFDALQSSAKSEHMATKVVSSFQLDSTAPGQKRSVTALVTGVSSHTAYMTAAAYASTYTKSPFASSSAPEKSHTPQQSKVGGDDEVVSTDLSASPLIAKLFIIPSRTQPPV
jgi:hypothetical protein